VPAAVAGAAPAPPIDATSDDGTVRVDPSDDLIQYLSPIFTATPSTTVPSFIVIRSADAETASSDARTTTIPVTTDRDRENIEPFPSEARGRRADLLEMTANAAGMVIRPARESKLFPRNVRESSKKPRRAGAAFAFPSE